MLKSKLKKIVAVSLIGLASLSIFSSSASATTMPGYITGGVDRSVWYSPSVATYGYTSHFDVGRDYWNVGTAVNLWKWDKAGDKTDRYYIASAPYGNTETTGRTMAYQVSSTGTPISVNMDENWDYAVVYMYDTNMKNAGFSRSEVQKVAAHEIGHSIKMDHSLGTYSSTYGYLHDTVMEQGPMNLKSTSIQAYDQKEVERRWGY